MRPWSIGEQQCFIYGAIFGVVLSEGLRLMFGI